MAKRNVIFLIQIAFIYSGSCIQKIQNTNSFLRADDEVLKITSISDIAFEVQWNPSNFDGIGEYTVEVPEVKNCIKTHQCDDPTTCKIISDKGNLADCYIRLFVIPCDDVTVIVKKDTTHQITFNLAPAITSYSSELSLNDKTVTISWMGPASSNRTICAKKARVELVAKSGWSNSTDIPALLGETNSFDWTLSDCEHGTLTANGVYLTLSDSYETTMNFTPDENFTKGGGGVTKLTTVVEDESCIITASWEDTVTCKDDQTKYEVTWGTGNTESITVTTYPIGPLQADIYDISVQAFWDNGDKKGNTLSHKQVEIPPKAPDAPTMTITSKDGTTRKLSVTWDQPKTALCAVDPKGHTIKYKVEGSAADPEEIPANVSPAELSDLEPCTTYSVFIVANSDQGDVESDTKVEKTGSTDPGKPTVYEDGSNTTSITLSWNSTAADSCPLANYVVEWSGEPITTTDTSYTFGDLKCNTQYTVTVTANTEDNKYTTSKDTKLKTDDKAPGKTTALVVSSVDANPNQLTVTWSGPDDYTCTGALGQYNMTWTAEGDGGTKNVTDTTTDIDDLVPCTFYTISVAARSNTDLQGLYETSTATKTSVDVPGKSRDVVKNSDAPYFMKVEWKAPLVHPCEITNYTAQWTEANTTAMQEQNVTETTYNIKGLNACTNYDINITAYTTKGAGEPTGTVKLTTGTDVPAKSTDLTNTSVTANSLTVSWSPPKDSRNPCSITNYTVQWVISGSGSEPEKANVTEESYPITGLIACTDYDISIIAYTEKGPGDPSETVTFTTDTDFPGMSSNIARGNFTPYSLNVTWSSPPTSPPDGNPCPITNYTVQWSNSSDEANVKTEIVTEPHLKITDLAACTDYYITVIACTEKGPGKSSEADKMSTGVDAPPVAKDKVIITPKSRDAQVNWEKPVTSCNLTYEVKHSGNTMWTNNNISDSVKIQTIEDPFHSATLEELFPYSKYDVCVTVNNNVNGEKTCKTFTTEEAVPSEPRNVSVEDVDDVSLTLTWEFPAAENGILLNYIVSWGVDEETTTNHTVDADITSHSIYELEEGKYFFSVKAVNSKGSSIQNESIEQEMNGPTVCGGGCIAGIVIGLLLVALAIPAFIFRDRIMQTIKPGPPPVEESPYELRGAAILKSDFRRHVEELGLDRAERAYQMLNDESQQKTKFAAAKPFNKGKNRFANIHPFDETRVKLQLMRNGPKGSDYINANHITFPDTFALKFTATQGPLDSTINDFWRMIWEHKVYDTVMLCNLFEKGKSKCAQYWTENGERSMEFGDFKISCQAEEEDMSKTFITRYIDVVKDGQHRMVKQHHFLAWPDFGVPENEEGLLRFLASVKRNVNEHGTNILTHCSAGVGRTGTFIALWVLTSLLKQNKSAKSIDVHQISLMMREGRSDMIQTKDQYLYLHKCLLKYMEDTGNSFPISNKDEEEPIYGNVNTGYQQ